MATFYDLSTITGLCFQCHHWGRIDAMLLPQSVLRGISQIFFVNHALCGVFLTVVMAVFDLRFAGIVLLGCFSSTLVAWFICDRKLVTAGVVGFNGALFAAISTVYSGYTLCTVLLAMGGGALTALVFRCYQWLFLLSIIQRFKLPVASAPFATIATPVLGFTGVMQSEWDLSSGSGFEGILVGATNAIAEVFFIDGILIGALLLASVVFFNRVVAAFIALGAVVGTLGASVLHGIPEASMGLYTYCTVLVSIAVGAVFFPNHTLRQRILLALSGCALVLLIQPVLGLVGLPVTAWPFLLSLWIISILDTYIRGLRTRATAQEVQAELPPSASLRE